MSAVATSDATQVLLNLPAGRTAVVTGAGGNLGQAVVRAFLSGDANVVLLDRELPAPSALAGLDPDRILAIAVDLLNASQVAGGVAAAISRFGRLDVLCNLAGDFRAGERVHESSDASMELLFDRNVRTILRMSHAVVPHMLAQGSGTIVNVAAAAAAKGVAGMGLYCAAKSSVIRLTESMSAELRESGINVNCVLPSILDTPQNRQAMPTADFAKWVSLDSMARVIAFLASADAEAIHGAALPVTGRS
jgi:NAD(P)-dependent dehydrogenase (short-subunit alcohol dehydrogenase family)